MLSYDDDFDSDVDEDDEGPQLEGPDKDKGQDGQPQPQALLAAAEERKAADSDEEDSDFENPDELEVPGGGRNLETIAKIVGQDVVDPSAAPPVKSSAAVAASGNQQGNGAAAVGLPVLDFSGMTKSAAAMAAARHASMLKAASSSSLSTSSPAAAAAVSASSNRGSSDDVQVVGIVPGSSKNNSPYRNARQMSSLIPYGLMAANKGSTAATSLASGFGSSGSSSTSLNLQSLASQAGFDASTLLASAAYQDQYYRALLSGMSGGSGGPVDLLQKSMQNGGLSSLLSNSYSNNLGQHSLASAGGHPSYSAPASPSLLINSNRGAYGNMSAAAAVSKGMGLNGAQLGAAQLTKAQLGNLWGTNVDLGNLRGGVASSSTSNRMMSHHLLAGQQLGVALQAGYGTGSQTLGQYSAGARFPGDPQYEDDAAAEDEEDMGVIETYSNYMPSKLKIGRPHPDPVVETASLASVEPPDVWYKLSLPDDVVVQGKLSALQLETIVYASQQHEQMLADGNRAGFLVGDGAGVGKGRTIAGIIYENFLKGRKRAIWVSVSNDLKYDAERDLRDIGAPEIDVHFLSKMKYAKINSAVNGNVKKGVIYATYSALIGESQGGSSNGASSAENGTIKYRTRLKQLLQWCGEDFDGCIIFDECHRAKNLCPSGSGKPTKTGQTVLELQNKLPHARIIYASATGASEPKHMAYMVRLGMWGKGSPFNDFSDFLAAVEKRGVGAMEIVAMDMKLRGMYIARQLSFSGVSFRIDEVELSDSMRDVYNKSVDIWVYLMQKFVEAASLVDADKKIRKTMWGQFWSAHQRFFKYLCIASKVNHVVRVANEAVKTGKCVVIGLQSTGEARTLEMVEKEEYLNDFVSTAKGVLQNLIQKHFPAPDRAKVDRILGRRTVLDDLGVKVEDYNSVGAGGKRRARAEAVRKVEEVVKRVKYDWDEIEGSSAEETTASKAENGKDSDFEVGSDNEDEDDEEGAAGGGGDDDDEEDFNPFGGSDSDEDDNPWSRRSKLKAKKAKRLKAKLLNKKKAKKSSEAAAQKSSTTAAAAAVAAALAKGNNGVQRPLKSEVQVEDDDVQMIGFSFGGRAMSSATTSLTSSSACPSPSTSLKLQPFNASMIKLEAKPTQQQMSRPPQPSVDVMDMVCEMRAHIMAEIEKLGPKLPPNTLDQLIDELGGPDNVSELTGRKGRMVADERSGEVRYESRCAGGDVPLETLNLAEKNHFMNGKKDVAIISEAASSGISLQADRRAINKKRRVHMTLELPWSADRAIQQFGRTHRSNQVTAPEYVLLISDLAGEHRFASIVAKRLESLGALTHGDRRAGESRDLSRFNIDNKYGRAALEAVFKAIMGWETPLVQPPSEYKGENFFKDIADGLVGVGLIIQSEDGAGTGLTLDKGYNDMSKFLNRILGMKVEKQNLLFKYFTDTLNAIINSAKRAGKYDQGILDVGVTEEDQVELVKTHSFLRKHSTGKAKIELHTLTVHRGLSWDGAKSKWTELVGNDEGFYLSLQGKSGKKTAILAIMNEKSSRYSAMLEAGSTGGKKKEKVFIVYRPNTGQQVKQEPLSELKKKYKKVKPDEAEPYWNEQFKASEKKCYHAWLGNCRNTSLGLSCETGLRKKTYNVLTGSVLSVWTLVEEILARDGNSKGTHAKMQVVRLKLENNKRIVGTLIPNSAVMALRNALAQGSEETEETIH